MRVRLGRIVAGAAMAEVLAVAALVVLVAVAGPSDEAAARDYAQRQGRWVGPLAGALFTLLAGWWVARGVREGKVRHGLLTGILAAILDLSILVATGVPFEWLFAGSNAARAGMGWLGGRLAERGDLAPTSAGRAG